MHPSAYDNRHTRSCPKINVQLCKRNESLLKEGNDNWTSFTYFLCFKGYCIHPYINIHKHRSVKSGMILSCCFNILLYWYVFDFLFMTLKWRSGSILIERTFLKPHNTNAHLHLVRTRRPWYQFLNHCDALCLGRVIESLSAIQ